MKRTLIIFVIIISFSSVFSQTTCETGIISNEMQQSGEIAEYYNVFAQTFEVPDCVTHIKGIEVDFVNTYYTGVMRLWSGNACTGSNPQPIGEATIGSENGVIGVRNSYEYFWFGESGSSGIEIPGPGTYTITFQMSGVFGGFQYDDQANYAYGEFYFLDLGDWKPYSGADLFFRVHTITNPTDITEANSPKEFYLSQNYPNPFNPSTVINYTIPKAGMTKIEVFNTLGQKVVTLGNKYLKAGSYKVKFNASNLTSGIYFYKLQSNNFTSIKKMMLVK